MRRLASLKVSRYTLSDSASACARKGRTSFEARPRPWAAGATARDSSRQQLRVANQRKDHLHKLSATLVREHDALCIEDLNVIGVAKTRLAKSVHDAGWAMLRFQLAYKARWQRKHLMVVGGFYPSSRRCTACGASNDALILAERSWACGCGAEHDRDLNAA
jgi:putative transposase